MLVNKEYSKKYLSKKSVMRNLMLRGFENYFLVETTNSSTNDNCTSIRVYAFECRDFDRLQDA